jgi:hypothetical protein
MGSSALCLAGIIATTAAPDDPPAADPPWRLEAEASGLVAIDILSEFGAGAFFRAHVARRLLPGVQVGARLAPLAIASGFDSVPGNRQASALAASGWGYVAFEAGPLSLSMGGGASTVNLRDDDEETVIAPIFVPGFRLGTEDGLHLRVDLGLQFFENGTQFGFLEGDVLIPVGRSGGFILRGGGGRVGYATGEAGYRRRLWRADARSVHLQGTFGFSRVEWVQPDDLRDGLVQTRVLNAPRVFQGPSAGVGLVVRL